MRYMVAMLLALAIGAATAVPAAFAGDGEHASGIGPDQLQQGGYVMVQTGPTNVEKN